MKILNDKNDNDVKKDNVNYLNKKKDEKFLEFLKNYIFLC
jgi:hypothetical protein